jgi:hypothetical protein
LQVISSGVGSGLAYEYYVNLTRHTGTNTSLFCYLAMKKSFIILRPGDCTMKTLQIVNVYIL